MLTIGSSEIDKVTVVRLAGALNTVTSRVAARQIMTLSARDEPRIAIDLSKLRYATSAGLRLFFDVFIAVRDRGRLVLFGHDAVVGALISTAGIGLLVSVCEDQRSALAAFDQPFEVA